MCPVEGIPYWMIYLGPLYRCLVVLFHMSLGSLDEFLWRPEFFIEHYVVSLEPNLSCYKYHHLQLIGQQLLH